MSWDGTFSVLLVCNLRHRSVVIKTAKMNLQTTPAVGVEKFSTKEGQNQAKALPVFLRERSMPEGTSRQELAVGALHLGVVLWFLWWLLGHH